MSPWAGIPRPPDRPPLMTEPVPEQSVDDTDAGWGEQQSAAEKAEQDDDWYRGETPPHHGD